MYLIHRIENFPIDSITYIIINQENNKAVIIDPGTENDKRVISYLQKKNCDAAFIILTHEHFDHILGVNYLRETFPDIKLVSSLKTSQRLTNPKKNLAFFNQINLVVNEADILIEEGNFSCIDLHFEIYKTPGHTDSSISLKLEESFFSGDFLLQGTRRVTNLPTGSKEQYEKSLEKYNHLLQGLMIYPGHGEPYVYYQN